MLALLPLVLLSFAPLPSLDVCKQCEAGRKGKLCVAHAKHEKSELERLRKDLGSDDARDRMGAIRDVAELTDDHENRPSLEVGKVLAAALQDDSLRVRNLAIQLLTDGQHPETTVNALVDVLASFNKNMFDLTPWLMGPGEKRGDMSDAMQYIETTVRVCGDVRDDRVVKALAETLHTFPPEMRGESVAMAATWSLLDLGTQEAVESVIKQLSFLKVDARSSTTIADRRRRLHETLKDFATELETKAIPEYSEDAYDDWKTWFKKYGRKLPKKLGKWRGKEVEE